MFETITRRYGRIRRYVVGGSIRFFIDNGWTGLVFSFPFRWFFGIEKILMYTVDDGIKNVQKRFDILKQDGFFSGVDGGRHTNFFIKALFASDTEKDGAFCKALSDAHKEGADRTLDSLKSFFEFIDNNFFNGHSADTYKQIFVEAALLNQQPGKRNALSQSASPRYLFMETPDSPLSLLLNTLFTKADCFSGAHHEKNKQLFINAALAPDKNGENALFQLLDMRHHASRYLPDRPYNLSSFMTALENAGCFAEPAADNKQVFINAILTPNLSGANILYYAACSFDESLQRILGKLEIAGCFTGPDAAPYKQGFIDAVLAQNPFGESALYAAAKNEEALEHLFRTLTLAGCFEGAPNSDNQLAFINAVFAENNRKRTLLEVALESTPQLHLTLKQLDTCHFGIPFAQETHKQIFIKAILSLFTKIPAGDFYQNPVLVQLLNTEALFTLLIKQLTAVGCFSHDSAYKENFMRAVLAQDKYGKSFFSLFNYQYPYSNNFTLLLKKLNEVGCFKDDTHRSLFIKAVKADGNAALFRSLADPKSYLALYECLKKTQYTYIENLLNEEPSSLSVNINGRDLPQRLLVIAMAQHTNYYLVKRLVEHGARLTPSQFSEVNILFNEAFTKEKGNILRFVAKKAILREEKGQEEYNSLIIQPSPSLDPVALPRTSKLGVFGPSYRESKNMELKHEAGHSPREIADADADADAHAQTQLIEHPLSRQNQDQIEQNQDKSLSSGIAMSVVSFIFTTTLFLAREENTDKFNWLALIITLILIGRTIYAGSQKALKTFNSLHQAGLEILKVPVKLGAQAEAQLQAVGGEATAQVEAIGNSLQDAARQCEDIVQQGEAISNQGVELAAKVNESIGRVAEHAEPLVEIVKSNLLRGRGLPIANLSLVHYNPSDEQTQVCPLLWKSP